VSVSGSVNDQRSERCTHISAAWNEEHRLDSPSTSSAIDLFAEGETEFYVCDEVAHAMFWRQKVTTSVLLEVKQMDLGNGGAGLPGSLGKLNLLETFAMKRNSS
jgi:hypothetical protein